MYIYKKIKLKLWKFRSEDFGLFRSFIRRAVKKPTWTVGFKGQAAASTCTGVAEG